MWAVRQVLSPGLRSQDSAGGHGGTFRPNPNAQWRAWLRLAVPARLLFLIEIGKLLLQRAQLRQIVVDDIGVRRIAREEILVVLLCRVESFSWDHLRHDRP